MPFNLRGPELLVLVLIILLLFGAKRLPDVARGLGRSLRIFKAETKDLQAGEGDARFYQAKITTALFYAEHVLPRAQANAATVRTGSQSLAAVTDEMLG